jgi:amidase
MSVSDQTMTQSSFVPHDLKKPIPGAAQGPLAGLTAAVKDMYDIATERTGGGSPEWLDAHPPATRTAGAVQKLSDAGATIIGKTICDEFFYSITGANAHYGTPTNPRAPDRLPGGSSSGSAAATAAGMCDFALGSDTGGSIRIPASFCGLYGIRPTLGRVDLAGVMAMAPSFDVPGWFAATPGVFRRVGSVILQGPKSDMPIQKVIVLDDTLEHASAAVAALVRSVLKNIGCLVAKLEHGSVARERIDAWREAFRIIQAHETWRTYGKFIEQHHPRLGPGIRERLEFAASVRDADAIEARKEQRAARERVHSLAAPGCVLLLPTAPDIAPLKDATASDLDEFRVRVMRLTCIAGIAGLPQMSMPLGTISGAPVGLSFIGWPGGDEVLLDLALSLARLAGSRHAE